MYEAATHLDLCTLLTCRSQLCFACGQLALHLWQLLREFSLRVCFPLRRGQVLLQAAARGLLLAQLRVRRSQPLVQCIFQTAEVLCFLVCLVTRL